MLWFCTVSDYKYLCNGLTLYDSLIKNVKYSFVLYYLCIDKEAYDKLKSLNLPFMIVEYAENIEPLKRKGLSYPYFCYTLASRYCQYLFNTAGIGNIVYIDSDILFYPGIRNYYEEIGCKSIAIVPHLHIGVGSGPGGYNVGVIYFKNDKVGRDCLDFWVVCIHDPNNTEDRTAANGQKFQIIQFSECSDQKFVEIFPMLYPANVHVVGVKTGHGAPWNLNKYDYSKFSLENKIIIFKGQELPLLFTHFSQFKVEPDKETYSPTQQCFPDCERDLEMYKPIYDEYFQLMKETYRKYEL